VVVGPAASDEAMFAPRAALAELIEISPSETALLVNLTSSERNCEGAAPPSNDDDVAVSLRLVLPGGAKLVAGSYGLPAPTSDPAAPPAPTLTTTVKLHGRRHELRPGGVLEVTELDASPQGRLDGLLKLEFPGDAERPSTRVSGRFLAHFCKVNRLR
jgi:hypothetical protein